MGVDGMPDAGPVTEPDATPSASVVGIVVKPLPSISRAEGVRMTIVDHPEVPAAVSESDGVYDFEDVPTDTDIIVRGELEGYLPIVSRVFNTGTNETSLDIMFLLEAEALPLLADISEVEWEPGTGIIMGAAVKRADGATMAGIQASANTEVGEIRYAADNGFIDPALTETSGQGSFVVWNLPPGDYTLTAGPNGDGSCVATGLDSAPAPTVRIYADTLSHVQFACD